MGIILFVGEAGGVNGEPVMVDGLFPQSVSVGDIQIDIGGKARSILPVFGKIQVSGKMPGKFPLEALNGGIELGVCHNPVAGLVILVHALFVMGDDNIRLYLADDVADGEANLVVIR